MASMVPALFPIIRRLLPAPRFSAAGIIALHYPLDYFPIIAWDNPILLSSDFLPGFSGVGYTNLFPRGP